MHVVCDKIKLAEFYRLKLLLVRNKDDGNRALPLPLQMQGMTTRANFVTEKLLWTI